MLEKIKQFNWKRHGTTLIKVMMDMKVLGLLSLNGILVYGMWDTFFHPSLDGLSSRDTAIAEQKKTLAEKENLQKQYGVWEQQLKSLDARMIPILPGSSSKVLSVTEAAELLDLAQGKLRDAAVLPVLQPPHDQRENVSLLPTANTTIDILQPDLAPGEAAADGSSPSASPPPAQPPTIGAPVPPGGSGASGGAPLAPGAQPKDKQTPENGGAATSIPAEKFDYDLKVTGTYPALMDLLNELVIRKKLIKINKVVITKSATETDQPDAKDYPDYPLKLDMVVSLSLFLYDAAQAPNP